MPWQPPASRPGPAWCASRLPEVWCPRCDAALGRPVPLLRGWDLSKRHEGVRVPAAASRRFDVVVLGATGFTGQLTAAYLARNAPAHCRWALAGRSAERLQGVRDRLTGFDPGRADLPLLVTAIGNAGSMRALAEASRVVITTVGPYLEYGEPVVAACAAAGTDYVDLAAEPLFV